MDASARGVRPVTGGGDLGWILEGEEIVRVPDPDVGLGVTLDFTVSFSFSLPFSNGKVVWRSGYLGLLLLLMLLLLLLLVAGSLAAGGESRLRQGGSRSSGAIDPRIRLRTRRSLTSGGGRFPQGRARPRWRRSGARVRRGGRGFRGTNGCSHGGYLLIHVYGVTATKRGWLSVNTEVICLSNKHCWL